jgi:hypothetical protein
MKENRVWVICLGCGEPFKMEKAIYKKRKAATKLPGLFHNKTCGEEYAKRTGCRLKKNKECATKCA